MHAGLGMGLPHCVPFPSAMTFWMSWKVVREEPRPSDVRTWQSSQLQRSFRQAFTGTGDSLGRVKRTVHAPQPPSPHTTFVPVRLRSTRRNVARDFKGDGLWTTCFLSFTKIVKVEEVDIVRRGVEGSETLMIVWGLKKGVR